MGNDFRKHFCCVTCGGCKTQELEEGHEGTSETKPILQVSGKASTCADLQPSPPALEALQQGSEEVQALSQHQEPSAAAVEAAGETCCAADLVGITEVCQADGGSKGEGEALTQADSQQEREEVSDREERTKPAPHASEAQLAAHPAQEEKLAADKEQAEEVAAGSELRPCAGTALQDSNLPSLMEFPSGTMAGQALEGKSSAGETLIGWSLLLSSVQVLEEPEVYFSAEQAAAAPWAEPAEVGAKAAKSTEHTPLPEASAVEILQLAQKALRAVDPSEAAADATDEVYFTPTTLWESPHPGGESLEPANQPLDLFEQGGQPGVLAAQMMESLRCEEPAELREVSQRPGQGALGELEGEASREPGAEAAAREAEPRHRAVRRAEELPDAPPPSARVVGEEETEALSEASRLPEELGSSTATA